jgi:hypothetical protein
MAERPTEEGPRPEEAPHDAAFGELGSTVAVDDGAARLDRAADGSALVAPGIPEPAEHVRTVDRLALADDSARTVAP